VLIGSRITSHVNRLSPIDTDGKIRWWSLWTLYGISNFFFLATWNARYWDGWFLFQDVETLHQFELNCPIDRCKVPFAFTLMQPLFRVGDWTVKLLVIISFAFSGWLFKQILTFTRSLSDFQVSAMTIVFVLLPINGARVSLSTAPATLLLPVFLGGTLALTRKTSFVVAIGWLLVTISAFQPSYQVFSIAAVFPLLAHDLSKRKVPALRTWIVMAFLLSVAPLHRFLLDDLVVKLGLLGEAGVVEGTRIPGENGIYNSIRSEFLARATLICGVLALPLLVSGLAHLRHRKSIRDWRPNLIQVGLVLVSLGTFPYMAVGHFANLTDWIVAWLPDTSDWDSRHQLLQGPGFALVVCGLLGLIIPQRRHYVLGLFVVSFLVLNVSTFSNYHVDGLKQRDIIEDLRLRSAEFRGVRVIQFDDRALDLNARGRTVRSYEWKGIAELALGRAVVIPERLPAVDGCRGKVIGKLVTVRKVSGRLKATVTRSRVATIDISDLVTCATP